MALRSSFPFRFSSSTQEGVFWMLIWIIAYDLLNIGMKYLADLPKGLLVAIKTSAECVFLLPWLFRQSIRKFKQIPWPKGYLFYALISYGAMYCTYSSYAQLPLPTATSIGFIEPSMTLVLAFFFLGLRMNLLKWLLIGIGYVGVLFMQYHQEKGEMKWILVALLANFMASITKIISKQLTTKGNTAAELLFYNKVFFLPLTLIFALPYLSYQLTIQAFLLILLVSPLSLISQYAYLQAMKATHFDTISPMSYGRILLAIPLGYGLFGDSFPPYTIFGMLLIVLSNYFLLKKKQQEEATLATEEALSHDFMKKKEKQQSFSCKEA